MNAFSRIVPAALALCCASACAGGVANSGRILPSSLPLPDKSLRARIGPKVTTPIQHVVIIVQENRSFDDLFQGFPGADTQSWGYNHLGQKIALQPVPLEAPYSVNHASADFFTDYDNGKMDGFDLEGVGGQHGPNPTYGYVPHTESKIYFEMAKEYALGDRMFTSQIDESFVSHQYIIAGQAASAVDLPSGDWGCDGGPSDTVLTLTQSRGYGSPEEACFDYTTLGDELDAAKLPWRFYAIQTTEIWSAYQAVRHIRYGPDWANVIAPNTNFISDVANGTLGAVTWIIPACLESDHSGCEGKLGPAFVASMVNAVGESQFWNSTQIFVMWDEWAGWYDHVPPPYEDYDGLGMRVGLLMIGPYTKQKYVSHVQYEHGSILRFAEDQFGLGRLSASDARANSPEGDAIDFTQSPRPFKPFKVKGGARDLIDAARDRRPLRRSLNPGTV